MHPTCVENVTYNGASHRLLVTEPSEKYAASFGFEWTKFSGQYLDKAWTYDKAKRYVEFVLGFPVTMLRGMRVLELGSGTGRFTKVLAAHADHVVSVDLSNAVYVNQAIGKSNVTLVKGDMTRLSSDLFGRFDLVFCLGVLQHTPNPANSIKAIFQYAKDDGLVVFNIYGNSGLKKPQPWTSWKYFLRSVVPKHLSLPEFYTLLQEFGPALYSYTQTYQRKKTPKGASLPTICAEVQRCVVDALVAYKQWTRNRKNKAYRKHFVAQLERAKAIVARHAYVSMLNVRAHYPTLPQEDLVEIMKCDLIDGVYATYDNPMSSEAVLQVLAEINQYPYSYWLDRNFFRCQKQHGQTVTQPSFTRQGVKF